MDKIFKMSKMNQTILNIQAHVLAFDDSDYAGLIIKAIDKLGNELPLNYRVISENKIELTQLPKTAIEDDINDVSHDEEIVEEVVEELPNEPVIKKRFEKEETLKEDVISDIYLFTNKDEDNFLIGSCSKENLTKLKISVSAIDSTFEISETVSDEDAKSLEIELNDGSVSTVFDLANLTGDPQIITLFNEQ